MPSHQVPATPAGKPKPEAQRNFTDPDSRIMVSGGAFVQAYNAQAIVDAEHQIILAHGVGNQAPDVEYFIPMVDRLLAEQPVDGSTKLLADTGYMSEPNTRYAEQRGIDALIAVRRNRRGAKEPSPDRNAWSAMRGKLAAAPARAAYARRKVIVEPTFGQIKEARRFRHFSMRGLAKSRFEWAFVCLAHNALKVFRALAKKLYPEPAAASGARSAANATVGALLAA